MAINAGLNSAVHARSLEVQLIMPTPISVRYELEIKFTIFEVSFEMFSKTVTMPTAARELTNASLKEFFIRSRIPAALSCFTLYSLMTDTFSSNASREMASCSFSISKLDTRAATYWFIRAPSLPSSLSNADCAPRLMVCMLSNTRTTASMV